MGRGRIIFDDMLLPADAVKDANVASDAAIDADKLQHLHIANTNFGIEADAAPSAKTFIVFTAPAACTIRGFHCLLNDTGTSTDVDFDLLKNGVSILSAAVNILHTDADRSVQDGSVSSPTLAAGDVLSIDLAVTSATGALGPHAWVEVEFMAP